MNQENTQKTILVVDDNPSNLAILTGTLKDSYKTKVAKDGQKAMDIVKGTQAPDLILLDIMMPGMDGYEVCRRLKSDHTTRDIPIIFVSAKSGLMDEAKGLMLGAADFIMKPVDPTLLLTRVRVHLAIANTWRIRERELSERIRVLEDENRRLKAGTVG